MSDMNVLISLPFTDCTPNTEETMADQADGRKPKDRDEETAPAFITASEAQDTLGDFLSRVEFGKESFVITRRGKPAARLVPVDSAA